MTTCDPNGRLLSTLAGHRLSDCVETATAIRFPRERGKVVLLCAAMLKTARPLLVLGLALFLPASSRADFPSVDVRAFTPPTDPNGSLYLEPTPTPGPGAVNASLWFAYQVRPAVLRDPGGTILANLLTYRLTTDLVANIGLGQRFALGFDVPAVLLQQGDDTALTRSVTGRTPPKQALGDVALVGKANLLSYGPLGGFGLSLLLRGTAPTGPTASYVGEGSARGEARVLAEYEVIAASVQATAGFLGRLDERDVIGRTFDHELPWGLGVSVRPQAFGWDDQGRWTWMAGLHGSILLAPDQKAALRGQKAPISPVMGGLAARFSMREVSFLLGVESSITRAFGNPPLQIVASVQWAPRQADQDADGVPDDVDQCPELPEDRDGFEDQDGCPDWDNDNDGIPDAEDACPNQPGERQADPKLNGCPVTPGSLAPPQQPTTPAIPSDAGPIEPAPNPGAPDAGPRMPDQAPPSATPPDASAPILP
jgi:hypothetical protein